MFNKENRLIFEFESPDVGGGLSESNDPQLLVNQLKELISIHSRTLSSKYSVSRGYVKDSYNTDPAMKEKLAADLNKLSEDEFRQVVVSMLRQNQIAEEYWQVISYESLQWFVEDFGLKNEFIPKDYNDFLDKYPLDCIAKDGTMMDVINDISRNSHEVARKLPLEAHEGTTRVNGQLRPVVEILDKEWKNIEVGGRSYDVHLEMRQRNRRSWGSREDIGYSVTLYIKGEHTDIEAHMDSGIGGDGRIIRISDNINDKSYINLRGKGYHFSDSNSNSMSAKDIVLHGILDDDPLLDEVPGGLLVDDMNEFDYRTMIDKTLLVRGIMEKINNTTKTRSALEELKGETGQ